MISRAPLGAKRDYCCRKAFLSVASLRSNVKPYYIICFSLISVFSSSFMTSFYFNFYSLKIIFASFNVWFYLIKNFEFLSTLIFLCFPTSLDEKFIVYFQNILFELRLIPNIYRRTVSLGRPHLVVVHVHDVLKLQRELHGLALLVARGRGKQTESFHYQCCENGVKTWEQFEMKTKLFPPDRRKCIL